MRKSRGKAQLCSSLEAKGFFSLLNITVLSYGLKGPK